MGLRALLIISSLTLLLLSGAAEAQAQDCAVGGYARVKIFNSKDGTISYLTEGVKVEVKGQQIADTTNTNGVYVLYIPKGVGKKVNLRFTYGKLEQYKWNITIDASQTKLDLMELPTDEAIATYDTSEALRQRVSQYKDAAKYATDTNDTELAAWSDTELKRLNRIGMLLQAAARSAAAQKNADGAAGFYRRVIIFQEAVEGPKSLALADTYEEFSSFLRQNGDPTKARMYESFALEIRRDRLLGP